VEAITFSSRAEKTGKYEQWREDENQFIPSIVTGDYDDFVEKFESLTVLATGRSFTFDVCECSALDFFAVSTNSCLLLQLRDFTASAKLSTLIVHFAIIPKTL
jgi:hypothetical protein